MIVMVSVSPGCVTTVLVGIHIKMLVPVCSHEDVKKMLSLPEY